MRSLLLAPACDPAALEAALSSAADAIVVDLTRSRADPARTRAAMADFLETSAGRRGSARLFVRIHGFASNLADVDLDTAIAAGAEGILLPGVIGGMDATRLDAKIAVAEAVHGLPDGRTRIVAQVAGSAHSMFQLGTHRGASHRLIGLSWSPEDLAADLGIARPRGDDGGLLDPFRLARTMVLLGAVAAEAAPIDAAFTEVDDIAGLEAEALAAARDGFTAKFAIDPAQIETINRAFTPSAAAITAAREAIAAHEAAQNDEATRQAAHAPPPIEVARAHRLLRRAPTV